MLHLGPLAIALAGGAAALALNRAAPSLARASREALVLGTAGALRLGQKLQELAEEAQLGLEDVAAEARARGGAAPAEESGPRPAPRDADGGRAEG
jgi:hypothetical protein